MKKSLFFLLLFNTLCYMASAQFVNFGQDRSSLRWKQIRTEDFQIIYPDFFEENAQKAANIFYLLYRHANTLQMHPKKISIILHADGGISNGNVALAPRKNELYTMPPQDPTDSWLEHLCIHEFRHIVQFDKVNQGLTKDLYYLFGEIFPIAVVGLYVPMWFMEGDAVSFETAVGKLGRGRSPEFLNEMKAQILEKGIYNYSKAVLGSCKDFVPDRYSLGYFMTANARLHYGSDIWAQALERTGRRPFGITPFTTSLKHTMQEKRDSLWQDSTFHSLFIDPAAIQKANAYSNARRTLYRDNFTELGQRWKKELSVPHLSFDSIKTSNRYYTHYYNPRPTASGKVIAYKKGLQETGSFVLLNGNEEKRITRTGSLDDYHFALQTDRLVWSEYAAHPRWDLGGRMQLSSYDLRTRKYKRIRSRNNRFSPFPVDRQWGCVEVAPNNQAYIVLLDSTLQTETDRIPAGKDELFIHPSYRNGRIYTVVQSPEGLRLESIDPITHNRHSLSENIYYELDHPVAGDSLLIYRASYNGNNAFYRLTSQGPVNILDSRYGLRFPVLSDDQQRLYFSYYTANGYKPGSIAISDLQDQPVVYAQYRLADSLKEQENWSSSFSQTDSVFATRSYRKFSHLVNIHSWGPIQVDLNDRAIDFGAVIYSQNKLSTLSFTAGYVRKSGFEHGAWMFNASYKGWWPVIDLDLYSGRYDYQALEEGHFIPNRQEGTFYARYKARQSAAEVTLRLPLTLSARQYSRLLQPYVRYRFVGLHHEKMTQLYSCQTDQYGNLWLWEEDPRFFQIQTPSRFYQLLEYGLYFSNQTRMTTQEINPRWGQTFSVGYTHSPLKHMQLGNQWWGDAQLYIPGFAINHSLSLYGGYQHMSDKNRNYGNKILYPRGITLDGYEIASLRTSYHLPLAFPDLPLGSLLYFKRLNAALFYDLGSNRNRFQKSVYSSCGIELTTDTHLFRLTYPIQFGIRTGYETQHKKIFTDLLFSIGLSI